MRKKKQPAHENHERWLVSYADFITLLFAFFVVMFASSQADKGRAKAVSEAVTKALEDGKMPAIAAILGGTVDDKGKGNEMLKGPATKLKDTKVEEPPKKLTELAPAMQTLAVELQAEIRKGQLQLTLEPRGLVISLKEAAFFASGDDAIRPSSYPIIAKLAAVILKLNNPLRLEGHTDSIPINTPRFHSNWELSAARSIAMLELLSTKFGVERDRMAIVGYADTTPVDSNNTEEGRARNRRVDIVLVSPAGMRAEPGQVSRPDTPATTDKESRKGTRGHA
ncbi:MAG: flagellar motor protein MotB [Bryobacteraceae bacterium]|jgi:chemotaxis protein MotB